MQNKQPDVVIQVASSKITNCRFAPQNSAQPDRETGIAIRVPDQVPIKFDNPLQGSSPNDTASCLVEVVTPSGVYFSSHSTQTVILNPTHTEISFHSPESLGLLSVDSKIPV